MFPNENDTPVAYTLKSLLWFFIVGAILVVIGNALGFIDLAFLPKRLEMENEARVQSTTYLEGSLEELSRYKADYEYNQRLIDTAQPNDPFIKTYEDTKCQKLQAMRRIFDDHGGIGADMPDRVQVYVKFYQEHAEACNLPTN